MSSYCMNNHSQGMRSTSPAKYKSNHTNTCTVENSYEDTSRSQTHWGDLPLAMAYVPMQKYDTTFDLNKALKNGTIFPELCKPFCGKGGGC